MPRRISRVPIALVTLLSLAIPAEALAARQQPRSRPAPAAAAAPGGEDRPTRNIAALQESLDKLARMDTAQWELLEILLTLDDQGWMMLKQILAMPPEELDHLVRSFETTGAMAGSIVDQSDPQAPATPAVPGTGDAPPGTPEAALGTTYIFNQIMARVQAARDDIGGLRGRVNTLLPDQGDVRAFFQSIPLSNVRELLDTVKESFADVVSNLDTLRDGYDSFDDAQMKTDLNAFIDDLEELARLPQELNCFDDTGATVRDIDTGLIRRLIDVLPKVVLLAMDKMLSAFQDDWRTAVREVIDRVPMDLREGICEPATAFNTELLEGPIMVRDRNASAALAAEASSKACSVLRKTDILGNLRFVRLTLKRISAGADSVAEFLKDDQVVNLTILAVGGGGAGTNVKLPAKPLLKTVKNVSDLLEWRVGNLLSRRDECLDEDERIERDLLSCTQLAEYAADLTDAKDVASRRVEQLVDAGVASSSDQDAVDNADDFEELCEAYQDILLID